MTIGEVMDELRTLPRNTTVAYGFGNPHSYRGYYNQCAFEPLTDTTVGEMLDACERAISGEVFEGFKGGDYYTYYTYNAYTTAYLAAWGDTGEEISLALVAWMLRVPFVHPAWRTE